MTPEHERRLRSVAANIVDLELRVRLLREANISGLPHEEVQQLRGDLMVAEANLMEAQSQATWLKMGIEPVEQEKDT